MATRGTTQYNVWKAKYDATCLKKQGINSLFSEEQIEEMATEVTGSIKSKQTRSKEYFLNSKPSALRSDLWERAVLRATAGGSKEASFSSVRAIYNAYNKRMQENICFSIKRAETERQLSEMFI